jgi:hypothetical protein
MLMLDTLAKASWIVGDHCRPTSERVKWGAIGVGIAALDILAARQAGALTKGLSSVKGTGAYLNGMTRTGSGFGKLANTEVKVSQKGLDLVTNHLEKFGNVRENSMMLDRLKDSLAKGKSITGADASFYMHEAAEATKMAKGMTYEAAHAYALAKYQVSPFSVYHPNIIQATLRDEYGYMNWSQGFLDFWGLK